MDLDGVIARAVRITAVGTDTPKLVPIGDNLIADDNEPSPSPPVSDEVREASHTRNKQAQAEHLRWREIVHPTSD